MKQQLNLFFHALQFYSRIPIGKITYSEQNLSQSLRYFPLVGAIVGVIGALTFWLLMMVLPQAVAVVGSLMVMLLCTGALHEDGVADFCDGFGGGYTKERILEIMKDSHIGAYGVIAIVVLLLTKFALAISIDAALFPLVLIAAHTSSRFMAVVMLRTSQYVRKEKSKSSHSRNKLTNTTVMVAAITAGLSLLLVPWQVGIGVVIAYALVFLILKRYVDKQIGGFTGDILGTLQQLCEIAFMVMYIALIPYC